MKIIYTSHAKKKFNYLKELSWNFKPQDIKKVLTDPTIARKGHADRKIAIGKLDENHELLIVYVETSDIITVVTFYPITKGRYD